MKKLNKLARKEDKMQNLINWNDFQYKNSGKETIAFEKMTYFLFCNELEYLEIRTKKVLKLTQSKKMRNTMDFNLNIIQTQLKKIKMIL